MNERVVLVSNVNLLPDLQLLNRQRFQCCGSAARAGRSTELLEGSKSFSDIKCFCLRIQMKAEKEKW